MTDPARIMERTTDIVEWCLHFCRVGSWVLVSAWCFLSAVRLVALAWLRGRALALVPGPRRPGLAAAIVALGGLGGGILAIRPDELFLINRGGLAVEDHDCAAAVAYLEPVARWNSTHPAVYENLALCYLEARRFRDAVGAFHRARALAPTPESFALCAVAHAALGETGDARRDLESALPLARSAEQRAAISAQLEKLPR